MCAFGANVDLVKEVIHCRGCDGDVEGVGRQQRGESDWRVFSVTRWAGLGDEEASQTLPMGAGEAGVPQQHQGQGRNDNVEKPAG
ncbi:hypothetical protein NDU88_005143 [Pleurodeles waltl]|uniref:Uncharacterized protein n=1 Tax=Pleurodeles waltl TaxID=8319 RepID=A0AAV7UHY4_PLEWA|nr:hypothetical protein NDU88_005143 [Pleurodeles waltl]